MITEPCLVATKKDVKELYKMMKYQIKHFGSFVINFEFDCSKEEYDALMEEEE